MFQVLRKMLLKLSLLLEYNVDFQIELRRSFVHGIITNIKVIINVK